MDTFLSVKSPLRYRIGDLISKKSAMIGVFAFWTVSLLLAMLPLFTNTVFTYALSYANFQYLPIITPIQVRHLFSVLGNWIKNMIVLLFVSVNLRLKKLCLYLTKQYYYNLIVSCLNSFLKIAFEKENRNQTKLNWTGRSLVGWSETVFISRF